MLREAVASQDQAYQRWPRAPVPAERTSQGLRAASWLDRRPAWPGYPMRLRSINWY
jgi:hypothetical protein